MATHEANVTSWGIGYVETDKGRLYYPIYYIDVSVIAGETYRINTMPRYFGRLSMFMNVITDTSDVTTYLVTEFETLDGKFWCEHRWDGVVDFYLYGVGVVGTLVVGGTIPETPFCQFIGAILVGTNGAAMYSGGFSWFANNEIFRNSPTLNTLSEIGAASVDGVLFTGTPAYADTPSARSISWGTYFLENGENPPEIPDPYWEGGTSGDDTGGNTDFDDSSDTITDSSLPTLSAADTGFTRIYNPTLAQVKSLANYLWTDPSIISTLWNHVKQFLENPMDAFIAFNLVPCTVPDGGSAEFKVMYIGTGVTLNTAANQFVDVDCGNVQIAKMYDSALDYSPYTRVSMFLPYIGSVELNCDEVMGKTLSVTYRIDIVSGGCVAKIAVDGSIRYQYSGHCAITIPFTSADFTGYVSAMIQATKAVASLAAGAAGMPDLAATIAGVPGQKSGETITTTTRALNPKTGRMRNVAQDIEQHSGTKASFASLMKSGVGNTVGAVIGSKPLVERTGSFSGNTGYLGVRRPYVIIERPRMCNPEQYGKYNGRPSMIYERLGNLTGYTVVQEVQLTGFSATNPELDEIGSFLKGGVIL